MVPPESSGSLAERVAEAALLTGDFVLSSGKRSNIYVDKYLFSTKPDLLADIAKEIVGKLPEGVDRLAGVELGAVPLAVAASLSGGLPYVIVRKETKDYGTSRGIEGEYLPGDRVVLVEDVVTTGTQVLKAAATLEGAGVEVVGIVAVLDRVEGGVGEHLGGYPFRNLLTIEELRVVKGV